MLINGVCNSVTKLIGLNHMTVYEVLIGFPCIGITPYSLIWLIQNRKHCNNVIMGAIAYQITSPTIVYSTVYSDADERKHQSSASLAFLRGIHRWPVNSPHKWPVTRKMFPFDDAIMNTHRYIIICWYLVVVLQKSPRYTVSLVWGYIQWVALSEG